ncbi:UvrD-helicase domain-containing protein [Cloacibacterium sp.]|uniref:UvrD-helicase domain-containing protein n=1 Tax=Cloacibacterium sp. TaxID=1913682 RepID=UPI0039E42211
MISLNSFQQQVVDTKEGPLLVIAGPGSGKTATLVERIVSLIQSGVPAEEIMVSTFTEKAAKELITRVSNRLLALEIPVNLNEMYIGTLHSIFLRFIEEFREYSTLKRNYRLLDQFDQCFLIFKNLNTYLEVDDPAEIIGTHYQNRWAKANNLMTYIGKVSEECLDVEDLCNADEDEIRAIGEYFKIYQNQLAEENVLDFSSIQTEILRLLEENPKVLQQLQSKIKYIMVDEYQDTNTIQEKILLLLASKNHNICVVGDDDQGLYRFRGATIRNILEFPNNFKKGTCKQVALTTNYRSHPDIIQFYNNWMAQLDWTEGNKKFRFEKTITPREGDFPETATVITVSNDQSFEDYCKEVLAFINEMVDSGKVTDYNQIAFLFKSVKNERVVALANYLEENGINIFSPRSSLFFERNEVQLLFGALIFIFPNLFEDLKWNDDANLQIWHTYEHWKNKFAEELRSDPDKHKNLLQWCRTKAKEHLILKSNTNYAFTALVYQLLEFPMFSEHLELELTDNKLRLRSAYNIALVTKLLFKFEFLYNVTVLTPKNVQKTLQELFNTYLRFIIDGGIEEYEDFDEYAPSGCVSFMTIHQSKGLEFPIVLVGSLNLNPTKQFDEVDVILQNNYYHKQPFEPIEKTKYYDFWRLFYTAFSRPQNVLALTAFEKNGQGRNPSKHFEKSYKEAVPWRLHAFDITQLELETIKPVNIKKEYSFTSHILLYENCPLQYKFYKELEFTEVRTGGVLGGSLLHQTIEDIHKAVLRDEVHTLTNENITDWFNENYYLLSKSQRSYLHQGQQDALLSQVLRYRDNQSDRWHLIKEAEVDVSLVKEDYILKGTIDLIEGENGTVELIDFKSGSKPDVNSNEPKTKQVLSQYRRQLEIYAHIVEERTGHEVSKMHLYYPKEEDASPYITFKSNKDNIQHTISVFDDVVTKIENKNYDMSNTVKSEKQCGECDMRFHCNPRHYSLK